MYSNAKVSNLAAEHHIPKDAFHNNSSAAGMVAKVMVPVIPAGELTTQSCKPRMHG